VDDTVLLKKTVLAELLAALPQLAAPRSGRRVLVLPSSAREDTDSTAFGRIPLYSAPRILTVL